MLVATRTYAGLPVKRGLKMMRSRQRGSMDSHGTCSSDHDKIDYQEWDAGTGEHCVRGRVSPKGQSRSLVLLAPTGKGLDPLEKGGSKGDPHSFCRRIC